ncbi:MAG: hypothetical protein EOO09_02590 [Chitinophagaceae bacterium]|nr:MAG: hypothetical protein EOO09_02590 [Chitinophagaceae bacterium]
MKKLIPVFAFLFATGTASAQELAIASKGNKVYIENTSKNDNAVKTADELKERVGEWNYWTVVNSPAEADFVLAAETEVSKGITATSWGGKSYVLTGKIKDKKGEVVWESNSYKSSPNGTNGFNSSKAVVKKMIRDLKKKFKD